MFNTPEKSFYMPEYANALAHHSLTSISSPVLKDHILKNPRVLKYVDISAIEKNVYVIDSDLSIRKSPIALSASVSSSISSVVDSSS
jgi:hypothetical protein